MVQKAFLIVLPLEALQTWPWFHVCVIRWQRAMWLRLRSVLNMWVLRMITSQTPITQICLCKTRVNDFLNYVCGLRLLSQSTGGVFICCSMHDGDAGLTF
uniref:Secreted protein n=1 Tax=Pyxicephalus adspersus TaxID=30357 RepID=A0AAV3A234_PYXAD|nr:TPA: hypothetical protein GDO54_017821 [Pyxicephalus adspersus]